MVAALERPRRLPFSQSLPFLDSFLTMRVVPFADVGWTLSCVWGSWLRQLCPLSSAPLSSMSSAHPLAGYSGFVLTAKSDKQGRESENVQMLFQDFACVISVNIPLATVSPMAKPGVKHWDRKAPSTVERYCKVI